MERSGEVVSKSMEEKKKQEVADDFIACEVLSRLPVKSLMRFKCVFKRWQSIIQKDPCFIDLHLSRSITARRLSFLLVGKPENKRDRMYLLSAELLLPSNVEDGCSIEVGATCRWEPPVPEEHPVSVCSLNGLICFMDTESSAARVYNSSTRESTPWIESMIKRQDKVAKFVKHEFGYDPATKEHKVIAFWKLNRKGYYGTPALGCEVMTVRQNSWRRVKGIKSLSIDEISSSVYVNGSIYLLCDHQDNGFFLLSVFEFSVGTEEFRFVETISGSAAAPHPFMKELMEVDGRLCVLNYNDIRTYSSITIKMLFDPDENVQDKERKMFTSSSTTMSIQLPEMTELNSIRHIPGTDVLIVRPIDDVFSFYQYNQENKSSSIRKINSEISETLIDEKGESRYCFEFYTFIPHLLPVN